jgi:phage terminase small subunit
MGLNPKQILFVKEYLIDKNATRAAKAAGYSAKSAHSDGPRLLGNAEVKEAIQQGLDEQIKASEARAAKAGLTKERWLKELRLLAMANMDDFATVEEKDNGYQSVKLITTMERKVGLGRGIKKLIQTTTQHGGSLGIELHSKQSALEILGKAYGWIKDGEVTVNNNPPQVIITLPSNGRELKK